MKLFLLITENEDQIINTIRSRCQALHFPVLSEKDIAMSLVARENSSESEALKIATQAEGNYNIVLLLKLKEMLLLFRN